MRDRESARDGIVSRRRLLQAGAGVGMVSLAGCNFTGGQETATPVENEDQPPWYGSGPGSFEDRAVPGGTSMADMPDMSGTLNVYSGRGQGLVGELLEYLETRYSNLTINPTYDNASRLANRLVTEGGNTPADVFYSVNAGALGFVANQGSAEPLTEDTYSLIGSEFRAGDNSWVGTSGRARTVPFNTNAVSESDVPDSIMDFPDLSQYSGDIGWAPTYGSAKAFVTAMRLLEGESATREWLNGMQDLNIQEYNDEYAVSQAVADGELALGLANHYYIQRVLAGRSSAPIDTAFTQNDAGTVFNVAGAARVKASQNQELADLFVRHLLSSEAQEYFAIKTFEYPLVDGVDPVGRLPSISDLSVPEIDLSKLSEQDATVELMRDTGVL
ncbi:extracellular solute-binding protein [Halorientalis salina]|uniref:extracellular solute-binding protein n=1 Tax=Halorientalis salina TaxID=2932266 RepID=UPI0010ACFEDD|nr:extracellular solute-binding protein [Halorientalis salina]